MEGREWLGWFEDGRGEGRGEVLTGGMSLVGVNFARANMCSFGPEMTFRSEEIKKNLRTGVSKKCNRVRHAGSNKTPPRKAN